MMGGANSLAATGIGVASFARDDRARAEPREETAAPPLDDASAARLVAMFDAHYDAVWRTLRRMGVSDASADDAAQRVFLVASRKLDAILPDREGRYLYGIAIRVASETRRRDPARREIAVEAAGLERVADGGASPEDMMLEHEARDALDATLAQMPDDLRSVLVLVELEGLSVPDLAAALGVPLGTASSRLRRAREAFHASARRVRARLAGGRTLHDEEQAVGGRRAR